jgi:transposase
MVGAQALAAHVRDPGRAEPHRRDGGHRQHLCESAPLGCRRPKKEAQDQAIGVSRGGRSTKIHLIADLLGRPIVLHLTPGHHADIRVAADLIDRAGPFRRLLADRAYDADRLRRELREADVTPIIPGRRNRKTPIRYDKQRYKERWRVEAAFCRLKDFRRVATRYDKLARTFLDAVTIATITAFWL